MTRLFDPPNAPGFHLPEDALIAMACEGFSPEQSADSTQHFENCARCQARLEQIQNTMRTAGEYRQHLADHLGPLPTARRDQFIKELDVLLDAVNSAPWWKSWKIQPKMPSLGRVLPIVASVLIVICAGFFLFLGRRGRTPVVSAAEFMNRAVASDRTSMRVAGPNSITRKFRVKSAKNRIERDTDWEIAADSWAGKHSIDAKESDLVTRLASAGVNWDEPLSADSFKEWHDRQSNSEDEIQSSGPGLLTMSTRIASSDVARESLTVREDDFHPVERTVQYRDSETIEISEVTPGGSPATPGGAPPNKGADRLTSSRPLEPSVSAAAPGADPQPRVPAFIALPSVSQLNETELKVRLILNQESADTGEQIAVKHDFKGVYVAGLVDTEARKREIDRSLESIPYVSVSVDSVDDLKSVGNPPRQSVDAQKRPAIAPVSPLEQYFVQQGRSREDVSVISAGLFNCSVNISRSIRSIAEVEGRFSAADNLSPSAIHSRDQLLSRIGERLLDDLTEQRRLLDEAAFNYDWAPAESRNSPMDSAELERLGRLNMAETTELVSGPGTSTRPQKELAAELARTILQLRTVTLSVIPGLGNN